MVINMLKVNNLTVKIKEKEVVSDVSFEVPDGKIVAIVGESGSGKTMTALSIMDLLPNGASKNGKIASDNDAKKSISMVFQEPMTSLNPLMTIGKQLNEVLLLHEKMSKKERYENVIKVIERVELDNADEIYKKYPHELSGGMRQRVMIAMALLKKPKLIIADEPTTALDHVVQDQIINLLKRINEEDKLSILFISHDLNLVKKMASYVIVMKNGRIVEQDDTTSLFNSPKNDYTKKLIESMPRGKKVPNEQNKAVMVDVSDVALYYYEHHKKKYVIKDVNFSVYKGEILGIVGRSGRGKTTLCRAIAGLNKKYSGTIVNNSVQTSMVFQDTYSSLNPSKKIGWIIEEPLRMLKKYNKEERRKKVIDMLNKVGLSEEYIDRYPSELSGGQRQRISIAAALVAGADLLVADEPVSALDVTVQAQILELILELQKEYNLTILFISHDINVIDKICDRVFEI